MERALTMPEREYFYHIDTNGSLIHDRTVLTDRKFLDFFFRRLKKNDTGRHPEYPYVSPCGKEMNYLTSSDSPIVFHTIKDNQLLYGGTLGETFKPESLVLSDEGQLYHPSPLGYARLNKNILFDLSQSIEEESGIYYFIVANGNETKRIKIKSKD